MHPERLEGLHGPSSKPFSWNFGKTFEELFFILLMNRIHAADMKPND
jgi:hypothetical protein